MLPSMFMSDNGLQQDEQAAKGRGAWQMVKFIHRGSSMQVCHVLMFRFMNVNSLSL